MVPRIQCLKALDDGIGFGPPTGMRLNSLTQISRPAIMEEEQSLSYTPQWRTPKLPRSSIALGDAVSQSLAHIMKLQVGEELDSRELRRMAEITSEIVEDATAGKILGVATVLGVVMILGAFDVDAAFSHWELVTTLPTRPLRVDRGEICYRILRG